MLIFSNHKNIFFRLLLFGLLLFVSLTPNISIADVAKSQNYVFLVDLSGSMAGENIDQAKRSLISVLRSGEINGRVSVVGFNTIAKTYYPPSSDLTSAVLAVEQLPTGGNTSLYDGIKIALEIGKAEDNASIIAISDGKDTNSLLTLDEVAKIISQYDGQINFLNLNQNPKIISDFEYMVGNKGKIIDVADLNQLLQEIEPLILKSNLSLKIDKASAQKSVVTYQKILLLFGLSLIMLLAAMVYFYNKNRSKKLKLKLLEAYDDEKNKRRELEEKSIFYRALKFKPFGEYVKHEEKRLLAAGLSLNIRNWIYTQIAIFLIVNLLLLSNGFALLLSLIFSAFIGFGLGYFYLNTSRNRKAKAFSEELPDVLTIISSSLKSGLNFTQAIESVAKERDSEVALQFRRVLAEVQLGKPITESLNDVADRMDSMDFRWTISALSIQREVGGNLSEILSTTAETIRGRAEIRREIQALSAEGRMSAYVLVALPFFMMVYLQLTKPDYLKFMFSQTMGIILMIIFALLILVGWLWVKKVVAVKLS